MSFSPTRRMSRSDGKTPYDLSQPHELSYDNRRTQGVAEVTGAERPEEKTR